MIKFAKLKDKSAVNAIRKQVHALHAAARPDMFRQEFEPVADRYDYYIKQYEYAVVVCVRDEKIVGFAVIKTENREETAFRVADKYLLVEELGVDEACKRQGVGTEIMNFVKQYAVKHDLSKIQLDYWAFNSSAAEFYRKAGFDVYRIYAEYHV